MENLTELNNEKIELIDIGQFMKYLNGALKDIFVAKISDNNIIEFDDKSTYEIKVISE